MDKNKVAKLREHARARHSPPEKPRLPFVGEEKAAERPDERRLAGPVGTSEAVELSLGDGEIEAVEGRAPSERLAQAFGLDDEATLRH